MNRDKELLKLCTAAWMSMAPFRARRHTCMEYSFGNQWGDRHTGADGLRLTEAERMRRDGRRPVTNNLIRQVIKTIIGKWKYLTAIEETESRPGAAPDSGEHSAVSAALCDCGRHNGLDARALEEFLISGCTAQRVGSGGVVNVSPDRLFLTPFTQPDASDARVVGMLHDMPLPEVLRRFSGGEEKRIGALWDLFGRLQGHRADAPGDAACIEFGRTDSYAAMRVIEVWHRTPRRILRIHDRRQGRYTVEPYTPQAQEALARRSRGGAELMWRQDVADLWQHTWLTGEGDVLLSAVMAEEASPELVVRCYPMLDGRVHSLVQDLLGQQRYVNRLVTLLDEVLRYSAKGALLFPTDQLPEGVTWQQMREIWSRPGAIIPFRRNSRNIVPTEINTGGSYGGAAEMLKTQLDLFSRMAGTPLSAVNDRMNATSADMLRRQMENEMISLLDTLSAFREFTEGRDARLRAVLNGRKEAGHDGE